jgi:DNA-binding beta-propeller fold protein YncE
VPILPFVPPQAVPAPNGHGFDYVTVDPVRRRVYAAHGDNNTLLIADADTGKVLGQVNVGPMAGVAVNEANGHVYTGDGDAKALSEVDPVSMKELHRVSVDGPVDAIAYDAKYHRIYGDEDDGTRIFVIDTNTFKQVATIKLPGVKPEYLAVDPQTHVLYQNVARASLIAVIDPNTLKVTRTIPTPDIKNNHPLQFDIANRTLLVGGVGVLSVYDLNGKRVGTAALAPHVDQCSFDQQRQLLACAANGGLSVYGIPKSGNPQLKATQHVAQGMHNVAVDEKTGRMWVEWPSDSGDDHLQGFVYKP